MARHRVRAVVVLVILAPLVPITEVRVRQDRNGIPHMALAEEAVGVEKTAAIKVK